MKPLPSAATLHRRRGLLAFGAAAAAAGLLPRRAGASAGAALHWRHVGDIGALPLVDATLHGRPWRVLLDTGSTTTLVAPALAAALALPRGERVRVATLGGPVDAERVALEAATLGGAALATSSALVLDLAALLGPALAGVDGLIGMPALRGADLRLDFAAHRVQLGGEPATDEPSARGLRFDGPLPVIDLRLGDREPAPFLLDTGNAGALVVFEQHARRLLDAAGGPPLPPLTVRELGGRTSARLALLARLDGPGFSASDVPVAFESGARARRGGHFDRVAGSFGCALLRRARVRLDSRGATPQWRIAPAQLAPLPGGFGLVLGGERPPRVIAVIEGSPAARAGLEPGLRLTAVAGRDTASLAAHDVWALLDGADGADFEFERDGGGGPPRATLQRERFLPRLA